MVSLTFDLAWPWSLPMFLAAAGLLVALTLWTYLGQRGVSSGKMMAILALRLLALVIAFLLILRPSLARPADETSLPSQVLLLLDASESMNITDEFNDLSRWKNAQRILQSESLKALREKLAQKKVELIFYQGAETIAPLQMDQTPIGKRTDMGVWLHELFKTHRQDGKLRGLALFSDGADNGTRFPTLDQAAQWRGVCPIHTFGLGKPTTTSNQRDIAITKLTIEPTPAPIKSKMKAKILVSAPGFENSSVRVGVWMEDPSTGQSDLVAPGEQTVVLRKTRDNEIVIPFDAPAKPGEVKVTVKVEPLPGEMTDLNNQATTYVPITKEGISILWVEGRLRAWEPAMALRYALGKDPRFRVFYTIKPAQEKPGKDDDDWYQLDKQHYDVIVIGDISAKRFLSGRPDLAAKIRDCVQRDGTGLIMLGGTETFANSDWTTAGKLLADLLPVELREPGSLDGPARMLPTAAGLAHYLLRLSESPIVSEKFWKEVLDPLDGMTRLGPVRPGATVLAARDSGEPMLVGTQSGEGRVLAFAGDTTWKTWRRSEEMLPAYERFWKQVMIWLARQENLEGNAWIKPDARRVQSGLGQRFGFSVGLRGKGGVELRGSQFLAKVVGPNNESSEIPIINEAQENRGYFLRLEKPGEYRIELTAKGKDTDGSPLEGKATSRFMVEAEDLENLRPAADHDFLAKISAASGGKFQLADEQALSDYLKSLITEDAGQKPRLETWPDWRRQPTSSRVGDQMAALWSSALLPAFLLFTAFLCIEWWLRRKWGLV